MAAIRLVNLYLDPNGDGFHLERGAISEGQLQVIQEALQCKGLKDVQEFLTLNGEQKNVAFRLFHTNPHSYYHSHDDPAMAFHSCPGWKMRCFVEQRIVDTDPSIAKSDKLLRLVFSKSLAEIEELLQHTRVKVDFWGRRQITFPRYDGSISLHRVADEIHRIASRRSDADNLSIPEMRVGVAIVSRLITMYKLSDFLRDEKNVITRILLWFREINWTSPYTPRFHIEEDTVSCEFRSLSENRYTQEIGSVNLTSSFASRGVVRYVVSEEHLRESSVGGPSNTKSII